MARLTDDQWADARQTWEADPQANFQTLAPKYGVSPQAMSKKAKLEGWSKAGSLRQVAEKAQLKADGKVAKVAGATNKTGAAATIDESVEIRAVVIAKHRTDWDEHRTSFKVVDLQKDFEAGKKAKIAAEMLLIRQKGERAAYGLDDVGAPPPGGTPPPGADYKVLKPDEAIPANPIL